MTLAQSPRLPSTQATSMTWPERSEQEDGVAASDSSAGAAHSSLPAMPASRRIPCLEEQCLAQLTYIETHYTQENVKKLSEIALVCKQGDYQIPCFKT